MDISKVPTVAFREIKVGEQFYFARVLKWFGNKEQAATELRMKVARKKYVDVVNGIPHTSVKETKNYHQEKYVIATDLV
jgi:hypothetical protein